MALRHYSLEYSTDNGANWTWASSDETPGLDKTLEISGLSPSNYDVMLRLIPLTGDTTPVYSTPLHLELLSDWTESLLLVLGGLTAELSESALYSEGPVAAALLSLPQPSSYLTLTESVAVPVVAYYELASEKYQSNADEYPEAVVGMMSLATSDSLVWSDAPQASGILSGAVSEKLATTDTLVGVLGGSVSQSSFVTCLESEASVTAVAVCQVDDSQVVSLLLENDLLVAAALSASVSDLRGFSDTVLVGITAGAVVSDSVTRETYWTSKPTLGAGIRNDDHWSARGLVVAFAVNEGSGTVVTNAVDGATSPLRAGVSWNPGGTKLTFAGGSNSFLSITGVNSPTGAMTVVAGITALQTTNKANILLQLTGGTVDAYAAIIGDSSTGYRPTLNLGVNNYRRFYTPANLSSVKQWAFTIPGNSSSSINTAMCITDTTQLSTYALYSAGTQSTRTTLQIGNIVDGYGLRGDLDYFYVYSRLLTPAEITQIYENPWRMFGPTIMVYQENNALAGASLAISLGEIADSVETVAAVTATSVSVTDTGTVFDTVQVASVVAASLESEAYVPYSPVQTETDLLVAAVAAASTTDIGTMLDTVQAAAVVLASVTETGTMLDTVQVVSIATASLGSEVYTPAAGGGSGDLTHSFDTLTDSYGVTWTAVAPAGQGEYGITGSITAGVTQTGATGTCLAMVGATDSDGDNVSTIDTYITRSGVDLKAGTGAISFRVKRTHSYVTLAILVNTTSYAPTLPAVNTWGTVNINIPADVTGATVKIMIRTTSYVPEYAYIDDLFIKTT